MTIENELKFLLPMTISEKDLLTVISKHFDITSTKNVFNKDTYFDDINGTLNKTNASFRIRNSGKKTIVTYKVNIPNDTDNIKKRQEYEVEIPSEISSENITIGLAIDYLKTKYPNIQFPNNLLKQLTIFNNRKIYYLPYYNAIIELALDNLSTNSNSNNQYPLNTEIEFELKSGNINTLELINTVITNEFPTLQKNLTSKYSRALNTLNGNTKTLLTDEVILSYIISTIIKSEEFISLKKKTQMLTDHSKPIPKNLLLTEYCNPKVLMQDILDAKNMNTTNLQKPNNIMDIFKCFFSDMNYNQLKDLTEVFFNENFYNNNSIITNRYTHSLQVMLVSMLIAKRFNINNNLLLLLSANSLFHDIGHVPFSHECESFLNSLDGSFSHEQNGVIVVDRIIKENFNSMINAIEQYYSEMSIPTSKNDLSNTCKLYVEELLHSISSHSTQRCIDLSTNHDAQIPRLADKIYAFSDAFDFLNSKKIKENLFDSDNYLTKIFETAKRINETKLAQNSLADKTIPEAFKSSLDTLDLYSLSNYLNTINECAKLGNYGKLPTLLADSVSKTTHSNGDSIFTVIDASPEMWHIINSFKNFSKIIRQTEDIKKTKEKMRILVALVVAELINKHLKINPDLELAYNSTIEELTKLSDIILFEKANSLLDRLGNSTLNLDDLLEPSGIDIQKLHLLHFYEHQLKLPIDKISAEKILEILNIKDFTTKTISQHDIYYDEDKKLLNKKTSLCIRKSSHIPNELGILKTSSIRKNRYIARKSYTVILPNNSSENDLIETFKKLNLNIQLPDNLQKIYDIESKKQLYEFNYSGEQITLSVDLESTGVKSMEILTGSEQILTQIRSMLNKKGILTKPSTFDDTVLSNGLNSGNDLR